MTRLNSHASGLNAASMHAERTTCDPSGFELLPHHSTLTQLRRVYEAILDGELDKRNFRKKVLATGVLNEFDEVGRGLAHRAARLYSFNKKRYHQLHKESSSFEIA